MKGDYYEIAKNTLHNFKIFFSRNTGHNLNQIWHKVSLGEGDTRFNKYRAFNSQEGDKGFFSTPYQHYDITIALLKHVN